jgi:hypothetical protein
MPWKAGEVVVRDVIPKIVQKEKRIEFGSITEAKSAAQPHAGTFQGRLCLAKLFNGSQ